MPLFQERMLGASDAANVPRLLAQLQLPDPLAPAPNLNVSAPAQSLIDVYGLRSSLFLEATSDQWVPFLSLLDSPLHAPG